MPRNGVKPAASCDWKKMQVQNTAHSRIKYVNACIQSLMDSLPMKTYTSYPNMLYTVHDHGKQHTESTLLNGHFFTDFPVHSKVNIQCAFCPHVINPATEQMHTFEQPQSRRRWTPLCSRCFGQIH